MIHQEVTYHRMAPPGTTSVEVEVYDVGKKVEGIEVVADIMRFQAGNGQLQIERTFAVNNNSKPPRTQMNEHNLEFYVPDGAQITEAQAMTAGGQPVKSAPVPEGANAKNRYAFLFPLRPGETRFNVVYTVPYTGSVNIDPKSVYSAGAFRRHRAQVDGVLRRARSHFSNRALSRPARRQRRSRLQRRNRPDPGVQASGEGTLAAPAEDGQASQSGGACCAKREPPRRRPRPARSTLPILCRNIAGGFSAASPRSSSSAESSWHRVNKPPIAPPDPMARAFRCWKKTKTTNPQRPQPRERSVSANPARNQRLPAPPLLPCCSKA